MTDEQVDAAFERLYSDHYEDLLRYALRRVDQPADAADVVAETWTVAWRRRDGLPPSAEQRLWLFGVARKVPANQRRGRLRQRRLADRLRDELTALRPPIATCDSAVSRAIETLSGKDRDLLALHVWEELSMDDIATMLGCTPAAARVRLHRARMRLRAALEAAGTPNDQRAALRVAEETR